MKQKIAHYYETEGQARISKAKMSLELLIEHPAGIGDHSTNDYYEGLDEIAALYQEGKDYLELSDMIMTGENFV